MTTDSPDEISNHCVFGTEIALCGPNADAIKRGGGSSEMTPTTETSPLDRLDARAGRSNSRGSTLSRRWL